MTRDEIQEFFATQQEYWRARDPQKLANGHAHHGTIISPIFRTVTGSPAILASYRTLFEIFPDWDYRGERLLIDGTSVAEPFKVTATHVGDFMGLLGTGRRFELQGVRLYDMKDGHILFERRYYDFTGLLIQLGVLRSKPAC
jgi:predicted ester cyclase